MFYNTPKPYPLKRVYKPKPRRAFGIESFEVSTVSSHEEQDLQRSLTSEAGGRSGKGLGFRVEGLGERV